MHSSSGRNRSSAKSSGAMQGAGTVKEAVQGTGAGARWLGVTCTTFSLLWSLRQIPCPSSCSRCQIWLLRSWIGCSLVDPWVKSWQGQSTLGWLKIPLVGIQNPGPQKFQEVIERGFIRFNAFLHMFPYVLNFFPQAWQSQLNPCEYTCRKCFFLKIYSTHLAMHWLQCGFSHE